MNSTGKKKQCDTRYFTFARGCPTSPNSKHLKLSVLRMLLVVLEWRVWHLEIWSGLITKSYLSLIAGSCKVSNQNCYKFHYIWDETSYGPRSITGPRDANGKFGIKCQVVWVIIDGIQLHCFYFTGDYWCFLSLSPYVREAQPGQGALMSMKPESRDSRGLREEGRGRPRALGWKPCGILHLLLMWLQEWMHVNT